MEYFPTEQGFGFSILSRDHTRSLDLIADSDLERDNWRHDLTHRRRPEPSSRRKPAMSLSDDAIRALTVADYRPLTDLLYSQQFEFIHFFSDIVPHGVRETLGNLLFPALEAQGRTGGYLLTWIDRAVGKLENFRTAFRENSVGTRVLNIFLRTHGAALLRELLNNPIAAFCASGVSIEIDPSRMAADENVEQNMFALCATATSILAPIYESAGKWPNKIIKVTGI